MNQAVLRPQKFTSVAPRLDLAINDRNTLIVRYQENHNELDNLGVGSFSLAQTAYNQKSTGRTLQVTETSLLKTDFGQRDAFPICPFDEPEHSIGFAAGTSPFRTPITSGSCVRVGNSMNITDRWEINNLSILSYKKQTIKWGGRFRQSFNNDTSLNNFNGSFTFFGGSGPVLDANNQPMAGTSMDLTGLQVYQRTLQLQALGFSAAQIRAAGGGASLFSLGAGIPTDQGCSIRCRPVCER